MPCTRSSTTPVSPDHQQPQCLYSSNQAPGAEHQPIIIITNNNLPGVRILIPPWGPQNMPNIQGSVPLLQQSRPFRQGMQISPSANTHPTPLKEPAGPTIKPHSNRSSQAIEHPITLDTQQQHHRSSPNYQRSRISAQRQCHNDGLARLRSRHQSQAQTPSQC